jgi:hypothetical protein
VNHIKAVLLVGAVLALSQFPQTVAAQRNAPAVNRCNPPRANLNYPAWRRDCEGMLQTLYRTNNPYRLPYPEFVRMYWQMYEVVYYPERHPGLIGSACSPEGSGYMNPSGHAQLCRNGRWTVKGQ